ncbi:MAG: hypothetical protein QMC67_13880 [Candidatus Wallbacteria bacterium]
MKIRLIFAFFLVILFNSYAIAEVKDTKEIEYNTIYKNLYMSSINDYSEGPGGIILNKGGLDYSVNILKNVPWSKESYCTLALLSSVDELTDDAKEETLKMIDKYISQQMSLDENIPEKLATIAILFPGISEEDLKNRKEKREIAQDFLIKLCNSSDKNYASLANLILIFKRKLKVNDAEVEKYKNLFKEKYTDHPALPILELDYTYKPYYIPMSIFYNGFLLDGKSHEEKIAMIKILEEKYKDIIMPSGDTYQAQCWACTAMCYHFKENNEKAKEYIKQIETKESKCTLLPFLRFMIE